MMRPVLLLLFIAGVYWFFRAVSRAAKTADRSYERDRPKDVGEEMVLDPECGTYVIKSRSVTRRVGGRDRSFCGKECADKFEVKSRSQTGGGTRE
jgi:uncharacterized protein